MANAGSDGEQGFVEYVDVLNRRKGTILVVLGVTMFSAILVSLLQKPLYEGKASLLVQTRAPSSVFSSNANQVVDAGRIVQTEIEVLKSGPVAIAVRKALGSAPKVVAVPVGNTDVVSVTVQDRDAEKAARYANAYANAYISYRREQNARAVTAQAGEIQSKISDLQNQIKAYDAQIAQSDPAQRATIVATVGSQRDALVSQEAFFKQKLDQAQVESSLQDSGAVLVTPATSSRTPVFPRPLRSGVLAFALGAMLAVGCAVLFDYLDDSIKSESDLEDAAPSAPVLGRVPYINAWRDQTAPYLAARADPTSPAAEAYRSLRTAVQFVALDRTLRVLMVTSPTSGDGKSTTLANLAVTLGRAGQRVIVVSCDLRRPRMHTFFGVPSAPGFSSVLLGDVSLASALQAVPGEPNIKLLASGPPPPNPSELLASKRSGQVLAALREEADFLLVDSPPVIPVTDAVVLSTSVDGVLLVATAGVTTSKQFGRAVDLLENVDAPIIGSMLNGVPSGSTDQYTYQYEYWYRPSDGPNGEGESSERELTAPQG